MLKKGLEEIDTYAQRSKFAVGRLNQFVRAFRAKRLKLVFWNELRSELRRKARMDQGVERISERREMKEKIATWS